MTSEYATERLLSEMKARPVVNHDLYEMLKAVHQEIVDANACIISLQEMQEDLAEAVNVILDVLELSEDEET